MKILYVQNFVRAKPAKLATEEALDEALTRVSTPKRALRLKLEIVRSCENELSVETNL